MSLTPLLTPAQESALNELRESMARLLGDDLVALKLFGSRARGDADEQSDVDVVLVVRNLTRKKRREILDRVADIELEWLEPLSLLVFSETDFERLKSRERRIAIDVEIEGIAL